MICADRYENHWLQKDRKWYWQKVEETLDRSRENLSIKEGSVGATLMRVEYVMIMCPWRKLSTAQVGRSVSSCYFSWNDFLFHLLFKGIVSLTLPSLYRWQEESIASLSRCAWGVEGPSSYVTWIRYPR